MINKSSLGIIDKNNIHIIYLRIIFLTFQHSQGGAKAQYNYNNPKGRSENNISHISLSFRLTLDYKRH